jgi:hypothetical protein
MKVKSDEMKKTNASCRLTGKHLENSVHVPISLSGQEPNVCMTAGIFFINEMPKGTSIYYF